MKLSAPLYRLRHRARLLSRRERMPLHQALDQIAAEEGYSRWSLLVAQTPAPARLLLPRLSEGDLLLLGARPGQGKTQLGLELLVAAMRAGRRAVFFTLEYNLGELLDLLRRIGEDPAEFDGCFEFNDGDGINADSIQRRLAGASRGTLAVIDYLQLMDQKRTDPLLEEQILKIREFARQRGLTLVFLSQIDRSFDSRAGRCPGRTDVRLPNPLNLDLFDKSCFLHDGNLAFASADAASASQ